jgi:hypothetical protein
LQLSDQGEHVEATPVGSLFRTRNEVTTEEGFSTIAPALKEEERPARPESLAADRPVP